LAVVPTIGPLSPGHVLLMPRRHITSFGELSTLEASAAIRAILELESILHRRFGESIAFEHGSMSLRGAGGCGVDHAHMHFVPVPRRVNGLPPISGARWKQLGDGWLAELRDLARSRSPYVVIRSLGGGHFVTPVRSLPSQFVRRWVAVQIGSITWDWRQSDAEADFATAAAWMSAQTPPSTFVRSASPVRAAS
jgi:diadenosine tetraphosphate (Ap4A) HIT family hydrolase